MLLLSGCSFQMSITGNKCKQSVTEQVNVNSYYVDWARGYIQRMDTTK